MKLLRFLPFEFITLFLIQNAASTRIQTLNVHDTRGRTTIQKPIKFNDCSKFFRIKEIAIDNYKISFKVYNFPDDMSLNSVKFNVQVYDEKTQQWPASGALIKLTRGYEYEVLENSDEFRELLKSDFGGDGFHVEGEDFDEAVTQTKNIKRSVLNASFENVCLDGLSDCRLFVNSKVKSSHYPIDAKICFEITN